MGIFFIYNEKFYREGTPVIQPGNRSLKYGDGLFETMKVVAGEPVLKELHFERLFAGMMVLKFSLPLNFTASFLEKKIKELCEKNLHAKCAGVRLMVFRGSGGLYDAENNNPNYIIESWALESHTELNSNGLVIDIYPDAKKSCDIFSNIKTNNFLPYVMAALYAKEHNLNDAVLLNNYGRICDSTIANIFIIKDEIIYTPSLSEGCIAGVMRRFIIEKLTTFTIVEKEISIEDLENADEVFLTNAIKNIRWVKQFRKKQYSNSITKSIHELLLKTNS